jgi:hypothetical protein
MGEIMPFVDAIHPQCNKFVTGQQVTQNVMTALDNYNLRISED